MAEYDHADGVQLLDSQIADTTEISANRDLGNVHPESPISISEAVLDRIMHLATEALGSRCESKAERRFLSALLATDLFTIHDLPVDSPSSARMSCGDYAIHLDQQVWEHLDGHGVVRFDFAFTSRYAQMVVEIDGHDWHERTKEQAERDKSRDRAAQRAGWVVLRFTGSEVFRDADKCAREAIKTIVAASEAKRAA